ncbi:MAG TPA: hypothetical protein VMB21_10130 [Candidatus Limnocylindria bacterium]|nr:hypothetical protein [Candidatus Limnocylindria bacterium]
MKAHVVLVMIVALLAPRMALGATASSGGVSRSGSTVTTNKTTTTNTVVVIPPALPPMRPTYALEILGESGTTCAVTVVPPTNSTVLWLKLHHVTATNEASLSINGGAWLPLNRSTTVPQGSAAWLNGLGGALELVAVTVPSATFTPGQSNSFRFRLDQSDGISLGYRVLEINFANAAGQLLFPRLQPTTLVSPELAGGNADSGSNLWFNATLVSSWNGTNTTSHCTDCHAEHGEDLRYFGFSDNSIYQRCRIHGLGDVDARDIVAYINSLPEPKQSAAWQPPYQPGPGLDSRPPEQWAAGAGMEWVLEKDSDTFGYLFGTNAPSFTFTNTINTRELPVALEMPSWHEWLPLVNPAEFYGADFDDLRNVMHGLKYDAYCATPENFMQVLGMFAGRWSDFLVYKLDLHHSGDIALDQQARYSLNQWRNVKLWDIIHSRHWEAMGKRFFAVAEAADRVWPDSGVFYTSPNFTMPDRSHLLNLRDGSDATFVAVDQKWYWLQLVLNDSQHHHNGATPIDWGYLESNAYSLTVATGGGTAGWPVKAMQMVTLAKTSESETGDQSNGDNWFTAFSQQLSYQTLPGRSGGTPWTGYDPAFANQVLNAWFSEWERWIYAIGRDHFINQTQEIDPSGSGSPGGVNFEGTHRNNLYSLRAMGASPDLLVRLQNVGAYLWPASDWSTY